MVDLKIITNADVPNQTYWKWKVVATPEEPTPADLNQYRDVTLSKVMLEYTRLKYNLTSPAKTDIYWSTIPYKDFAKYQVVCIEGNTKYKRSAYPRFLAETPIFFDIYATMAALGESFFDLEAIMTGIQAVWLNYDPMKVNGLHDVMLEDKIIDQETLSRNRTQFEDSVFLKELVFSSFYEVQRTTNIDESTFTYTNPEIAGEYAN